MHNLEIELQQSQTLQSEYRAESVVGAISKSVTTDSLLSSTCMNWLKLVRQQMLSVMTVFLWGFSLRHFWRRRFKSCHFNFVQLSQVAPEMDLHWSGSKAQTRLQTGCDCVKTITRLSTFVDSLLRPSLHFQTSALFYCFIMFALSCFRSLVKLQLVRAQHLLVLLRHNKSFCITRYWGTFIVKNV